MKSLRRRPGPRRRSRPVVGSSPPRASTTLERRSGPRDGWSGVVAASEGHSANTLICPDEIGFHYPAMDGVQNPLVHADMTFFETPGGGAVFSVGSIAWAASLPHNGYDNNISRLTGNVIRRFVDDTAFEMPS